MPEKAVLASSRHLPAFSLTKRAGLRIRLGGWILAWPRKVMSGHYRISNFGISHYGIIFLEDRATNIPI